MFQVLLLTCLAGAASAEYVTLEQNTNLVVQRNVRGLIVTPGFRTGGNAPPNFAGAITIQTPRGFSRVRLDFADFDLETSAQCSGDYLSILEPEATHWVQVSRLCSDQRPKPYLSDGRQLRLKFITDDLKSSRGFNISFRATNDRSLCNAAREFQCSDTRCIPSSKRCDGRFDCQDASDELSCGAPVYERHLKQAACGDPAIEPNTAPGDRIVNGQEAVPHSWPWQVSIQLATVKPSGHFCGGALVENNFVVTAGHCLRDRRPEEIVIKIGAHDLLNDDGVQYRKAQAFSIHPSYSERDMSYDVAVIKLNMPVNFTDTVRPVCLPGTGATLPKNTTCFSTGWGQTRGTGHSTQLKQTRQVVQRFDACEADRLIQPVLQANNVVCAKDESESSGPCHGDSGGPFVCQSKGTGRWFLHGMTSMGVDITYSSAICGIGSSAIWSSTIAFSSYISRVLRLL
uniref:Putative serine protease n=1 Tax=Ixodes scapularis TaxID=6945 RepID=A0A4D5RFD8_IXOSC